MKQSIPVVDRVDVLILGGTSAGVAAALAAEASGARVMLIASRSYLGEDIASQYKFWDTPIAGVPLSEAVFGGSHPPTPMHVKLTLEQAVIDAGIPLVLLSTPVGVVRDADGCVRGAAIANRSGYQAVLAGRVIDASIEGSFGRLAGHAMRPATTGVQTVSHTVLCNDEAEPIDGLMSESLPGYAGKIRNVAFNLTARRYTLDVDFGDGSPAALAHAEAEVVERCWVPRQQQHQEQVLLAEDMPGRSDGSGVSAETLCVDASCATLSPSAELPDDTRAALNRPSAAMRVGALLGEALAAEASAPERDVDGLTITAEGATPVGRGDVRILNDPLRPGGDAETSITFDPSMLPHLGAFDVVVAGGGTGGAPAAISAAEAGASTVVIEAAHALGGVGTIGQIAKYYYGNCVGFTSVIDAGVDDMEFRENFKRAKGGWSQAAKCAYFHRQCHERGVSMWFRSVCVGVWVDGDTVRGVVVAGPNGYGLVECKAVVDSTGGADIPAMAGAATRSMGADHVAVQGVGLAGIAPGRDYHNSDHSFSDDTDTADATAFFVSAKRKFADHFDAGQLIDSRERRQIVGEIELEPADFLYERRFPDTICVSSSNFDTHGFTVHPVFMVKPPDKERLWVDVPYRCLLPVGIEGVLVTGLGVSAHRDAIPVIRMQPDVQNQGYAAGRAAAMAVKAGVHVRDIDLKALQQHLVDLGCLPQRVLTDQDTFPVDESEVDRAVAEGFDHYAGLSLLFYEDERAKPKLRDALAASMDEAQRTRYALILALMNDPSGHSVLRQACAELPWDDGWNYTGMGQYGMSLSAFDTLLIGLGTIGDASAWDVLTAKAQTLTEQSLGTGALPDFSHCRALAVAYERLSRRHPNPEACHALEAVMRIPGVGGHAQPTIADVQAALTEDTNETTVRNNALRELHLGRGLLAAGDPTGLGAKTLAAYADDLRGHFARHARANLDMTLPGWAKQPEPVAVT